MMGKNHKAIGTACAIALASYGVSVNEPVYLAALVLTPIGAMLPDIDHDNSKLGKTKNKYLKYGGLILGHITAFGIGIVLTNGYYTDSLLMSIALLGVVALMVLGIGFIKKSALEKKYIKFFVKHRGIMHTLILPMLCLALSYVSTNKLLGVSLMTLSVGYISHLLSDSLTVAGCPLIYPFSMKNVGLKLVRTNTIGETIVTFTLIGGLLWLSISFWII